MEANFNFRTDLPSVEYSDKFIILLLYTDYFKRAVGYFPYSTTQNRRDLQNFILIERRLSSYNRDSYAVISR